MKKRVALFIVMFALCISCFYTGNVFADEEEKRVDQFKLYYTEFVNLPENVVVLTPKTSDSSSDWEAVGINSVSNAKKDFENRNVVAAIGDKNTKGIVYFISKNSGEDSSLLDTFSTIDWEDDKLIEYAKNHSSVENSDITASVYHHEQGSFFVLDIRSEGMKEVIYGTILNGLLVEFSMDNEIGGAGVQDEFLKQVVDSVHFTHVYTREEYDKAVAKTWKTVFGVFGTIVLIFAALVVIHFMNKKKAKNHAAMISDKMADFRKKQREGQLEGGEPAFTVETVYDANLMSAFTRFTTWRKNIVSHVLCAFVYAIIMWYTFANGNRILFIFTVGIAIIVIYMMYTAGEKKKDNLSRQFVVSQKKTAIFKFYEEYLTMSGISSITEFIYAQITEARLYNGYLFLYMSSEYALMLDLEGMEEEKAAALYGMVKEKIKIK